MIRSYRHRIEPAPPRPILLSLALLTALAVAAASAAQTPTKVFVLDLKASGAYEVLKNGSALASSNATPQGVLSFSQSGATGDVILVAEDSTASAVVLSAFDARVEGQAVSLEWDLFSDEALRGFVVCRAGRADPGRGKPVHDEPYLPPAARSLVDRTVAPATWYRYTVVVIREDGTEAAWLSREIQAGPALLQLDQNAPNPFNPQTSISFVLPAPCAVRLDVFDVSGGWVATLADGAMPPGRHDVRWDGTDHNGRPVAAGTYFYRLTAGKRSLSRKMLLLK